MCRIFPINIKANHISAYIKANHISAFKNSSILFFLGGCGEVGLKFISNNDSEDYVCLFAYFWMSFSAATPEGGVELNDIENGNIFRPKHLSPFDRDPDKS